jgi:hypothetical protein
VSRCRINTGKIAMTWSDTFLGILKDNGRGGALEA